MAPPRYSRAALAKERPQEKSERHGNPQSRQVRPARLCRRPRLQQFRLAHRSRSRRARWCTGRSTSASRCSTPPTSMATGGRRTCSARCLGHRRKDIVLATKFSAALHWRSGGTLQGASRRYIISAVEASLRRLKTDWIDLYQHHWPDPLTPIEETLRALDDLIRQGKVRYIGISNLPAWRVAEAQWTGAPERAQSLRVLPGRIQPPGARRRSAI